MANSSIIDDDAVTVSAPPIVPPSDKRPKSVPVQLTRRPDTVSVALMMWYNKPRTISLMKEMTDLFLCVN